MHSFAASCAKYGVRLWSSGERLSHYCRLSHSYFSCCSAFSSWCQFVIHGGVMATVLSSSVPRPTHLQKVRDLSCLVIAFVCCCDYLAFSHKSLYI